MSRIRVQCPNCSTPYRQNGRFCSVCGRARDEKTDAEIATGQASPEPSVQMTASPTHRAPSPASYRTRTPNATFTPPSRSAEHHNALPALRPGVIAVVALVFFSTVWIGRRMNAPQKPTHPVVAPLLVVPPDQTAARRNAHLQEIKSWQDLREAESYSGELRAEADAARLQAELRNAQAPPPSADPKPFTVIPLPPPVPSAASPTEPPGGAYP